jgi:hypothetical protein
MPEMTTRRAIRPPQVRPRPPSSGRPAPARLRPRTSTPVNLVRRNPRERGPGLPLPARLMLVVALVLLGGTILYASTGQLGKVVASFGGTIGGLISRTSETPAPSASVVANVASPVLIRADEEYTNQPTVDLQGTLPAEVAGRTDYKVRIYRALGDENAPRELVRELAIGATPQFTVAGVTLEKGVNFFTATLKGPSPTETAASPAVRYVYDTSKPRITLTSPRDGDTINAKTVELKGQVQSRSVVVARNAVNGASVTGKAAPDGTFSLTLALEPGQNGITLGSTDPAGNESELVISVLRGSGKLTATLTTSAVQFQTSNLPDPLTLTATVTDPDGRPADNANVTFTLSIPGVDPITQVATTDANGRSVFQTSVPKGATVGTGLATILVDTQTHGSVTARAVIAIVK